MSSRPASPNVFVNDTHIEEIDSVQKFIEIQDWLLLTFFICLHNNYVLLILLLCRCLKNIIHQVGSKNEWLLFSVTFMAKLELDFVLTLENAFLLEFLFQSQKKSIGSSEKRY